MGRSRVLPAAVVVGGLLFAACQFDARLEVANPCDFPVTVIAEGPVKERFGSQDPSYRIVTIPPLSTAEVLEEIWSTGDRIRVDAVQVGASIEAVAPEDRDLVVRLPEEACSGPRSGAVFFAVVVLDGERRSSWVDMTGTPEALDTVATRSLALPAPPVEVTRPAPEAIRLRYRLTEPSPGLVAPLVDALRTDAPGDVTVAACFNGGCETFVLTPGAPSPDVTLPRARRGSPDALGTAAGITVGVVAIGSFPYAWWSRRRARAANRPSAPPPPAVPEQRARSASPYEEAYGFARAVRAGDRVIVAGTAPIPPRGGRVAPDAYGQMRRCAEIIVAALAEVGAGPEDVVRTRMFITDAADADAVGRAHAEAFGNAAPAATMVVVAGLLDPEWKVEVEAEAVLR